MVLREVTTLEKSQLEGKVEVIVGKLKNGKDEVTGEMVKGGDGLDLEAVEYGF